jgi:signal transduction histidine kinase
MPHVITPEPLAHLPPGAGAASPRCTALLLATDWAATPLGPMRQWPQSLRIAVSICLNSRFPMFVWWGPQLVNIYNDAYIPVLGARHPRAFGGQAREVWSEIWDVVGPQQVAVMERGEATWNERVRLLMERNGYQEETFFTWSYSPIYREDGAIGGLFCACTEETRHVAAERERDRLTAQAQDTARMLQAWFDNAPGFIALLRGPEHRFEMINKAYLQLVGHRDIVGVPLHEALPEVGGQGFGQLLDEVRRTGRPFIGRGIGVKLQREPHAPAVERFLDVVYQPVLDAAGEVTGIFAQGQDVTEQVMATVALREADRRKDEFLATLAHELRNPLAPIRQAVHIARLAPAGDARRERALEIIARQAGHMALLIDDLLDLSRISRGKLQLRREAVDLRDVVQQALETTTPAIEARGHRLVLELPHDPVPMEADPLRLAQVIANLLSNAAKYTDPGGTITLQAALDGGEAVVRVRDTGIGLSVADQQRIFTMFSQVGSALDRAEGGLGIGLALSRGLVELHGGAIGVRSAGRGRGAEFSVRLPLQPAGAPLPSSEAATGVRPLQPPAAPPEREPAAAGTRRRRVLVADDNADALETLAMLLGAEGHEVLQAADGQQALELALAQRPDVAVLDIGMPRRNGFDVALALRASEAGHGMVLIALTGWGQEQDRRQAAASGFDHHCTKPVEVGHLLDLVRAGA